MASSRIDYSEYTMMMIVYVILYAGVMYVVYLMFGQHVSMEETVAMAISIVVTSVIFTMLIISLYRAKVIKTNPAILS